MHTNDKMIVDLAIDKLIDYCDTYFGGLNVPPSIIEHIQSFLDSTHLYASYLSHCESIVVCNEDYYIMIDVDSDSTLIPYIQERSHYTHSFEGDVYPIVLDEECLRKLSIVRDLLEF